MNTQSTNSSNSKIYFILALFGVWALWRIFLFVFPGTENFATLSFAWGATYQIVAVVGALFGLVVSKHWGGWSSTFGKTIQMFSVGLLFQSLGQAISSYYVYLTGEVPYPSIGDIGFFGSIIFYIFGAFLLAKVSGVKSFIKNSSNKIFAVLVPLVIVGISYYIFLKGYAYDWSNPLLTFLDFGYPIYQAIYVAIALLTLLLSKKYLGGVMKKPVLFFLFALIMQYISDFVFLYQISRGWYIPEGLNDCMYFFSYFLMAIAIIYTDSTFKKIAQS